MAAVMTHKMAAVARNHGKFARAETHVYVAKDFVSQTPEANISGYFDFPNKALVIL